MTDALIDAAAKTTNAPPAIGEYVPLAKYTAWRIGGPARYFASVAGVEDLRAALAWAAERAIPIFLLGGGTNLLIDDAGWPGLALRYRAQDLRVEGDGATARALVAAGAPMAGTARRLAGRGWAGLQWAEGLPGTIGGALFGNAGCYGGEIAAALVRAWLLIDDALVEWPVERFAYGYRASALKTPPAVHTTPAPPIVVAAEFALSAADPRALAEQMRAVAVERKGKTPVGSSCGSVFKNPPGSSAGRLIDAAGLKGSVSGGAMISDKHANYIVNRGGASSADVLRLIDLARERVLRAFGVELALEVQLVR